MYDPYTGERKEAEERFRGIFIPVELWELLAEGEINAAEMVLTALIQSHTSYPKRTGCTLTDEQLAEAIGLIEPQVRRSLSKLSKMGIVWRIKREKSQFKRELVTMIDNHGWSDEDAKHWADDCK